MLPCILEQIHNFLLYHYVYSPDKLLYAQPQSCMCRLYNNNHFPILQSLLIRAQCTGIDKSNSKGLQVTSTSKTHIKSHEDDLKILDEVLDDIKFKSIKIVDEKFLIECSSMKLPCGHGIAPHSKSLSEYCIKQVSKGNTEIKCLVCDKKLELSML